MTKWNIRKLTPIFGIILIIIGLVFVISSVPEIQQSIWPYEDAVTELAKKVSPIKATRILVGIIVMIAGFILLFKDKLSKWRK